MFDEMIDHTKKEIINSVCDLIKFPSVSEETNLAGMPFGKACHNALDYILRLGKQMGFRTKNIDGYCGYIEFGEGEELVGIVGHLDVVPALLEDGWTTPPFEPTIRDGKLFGRGSIDDKGPVIAALYAMKAVFDCTKVHKRVRLIIGLNEEKDWKCIQHYKQVEESPTISFSPDANFPAIYAEKGILSVQLKHPFFIQDVEILHIDCKKNALNVVPKYCSITLRKLSKEQPFSLEAVQDVTSRKHITIEKINDDTIKIISHGVASHAAHPELGVNAIKNLLDYLLEHFSVVNAPQYDFIKKIKAFGLLESKSPNYLSRKNILEPTSFEDTPVIQDESGILTSNLASLDYINGNIILKFNLRVPVKTDLSKIKHQYETLKEFFEKIEVSFLGEQNPLYIEKNSYLVKTLVDIFNRKTGMQEEAIAIGGGTYARAFQNSISYGLTFPGDSDMCHQVDEFVEIDKLILSAKIYAEAIYTLAK